MRPEFNVSVIEVETISRDNRVDNYTKYHDLL